MCPASCPVPFTTPTQTAPRARAGYAACAGQRFKLSDREGVGRRPRKAPRHVPRERTAGVALRLTLRYLGTGEWTPRITADCRYRRVVEAQQRRAAATTVRCPGSRLTGRARRYAHCAGHASGRSRPARLLHRRRFASVPSVCSGRLRYCTEQRRKREQRHALRRVQAPSHSRCYSTAQDGLYRPAMSHPPRSQRLRPRLPPPPQTCRANAG